MLKAEDASGERSPGQASTTLEGFQQGGANVSVDLNPLVVILRSKC